MYRLTRSLRQLAVILLEREYMNGHRTNAGALSTLNRKYPRTSVVQNLMKRSFTVALVL